MFGIFRRFAIIAIALAPLTAQGGWSTLDVEGEEVRIFRDDFGRPHIFATTNRGLFTAYGYALAEDRLWQLELNRRAARGRLAEIFGPIFVLTDFFIRATGYTEAELDAQFAALDAADQAIYRAYVAGINRFIAEMPASRIPFEFHAVGVSAQPHFRQMLAWTTRDTTAFAAFMARRFGEVGGGELNNQTLLGSLVSQHGLTEAVSIFNDVRWLIDSDSPATIPQAGAFGRRQHAPRAPHATQLRKFADLPSTGEAEARKQWEKLGVPSRLGSYAWVVSPAKSAEGYAMLYGGPQMGFAAPEIVHEIQLKSDEGFNVTGMAVAGIPFVLIGRNRHIAWTFTTGLANDNVDTYVEELCDAGAGSGSGHIFEGTCRAFEARIETINVRGASPEQRTVLRSVHGPIVGVKAPYALAQKRAHWMTELASVARVGAIDRAQNISEFERQIRAVTVAFNALYADHRGNIAYWFAGLNPIRPARFDVRLPLPGDGSAEWMGFHPIESSINPEQGWLANWNNRPTRDYPGNETSFGTIHRANDLFARFAASSISLEDMRDIPKDIARVKGSTGRESRFLLPHLFQALNAVPPSNPAAAAARAVLETWDGNAFADAVSSTEVHAGELIFSAWLSRALANTFGDELKENVGHASSNMLLHVLDHAAGGESSVLPSRDYFNGESHHAVLARSFDEAIAALAASHPAIAPSAWSAPRGEIAFNHALLGTVATVPLSNRATYGQIVQLTSPRAKAENIFTLGQSGHMGFLPPSTPLFDAHYFDQNGLYRNFEYKPMPLYLNTGLHE